MRITKTVSLISCLFTSASLFFACSGDSVTVSDGQPVTKQMLMKLRADHVAARTAKSARAVTTSTIASSDIQGQWQFGYIVYPPNNTIIYGANAACYSNIYLNLDASGYATVRNTTGSCETPNQSQVTNLPYYHLWPNFVGESMTWTYDQNATWPLKYYRANTNRSYVVTFNSARSAMYWNYPNTGGPNEVEVCWIRSSGGTSAP